MADTESAVNMDFGKWISYTSESFLPLDIDYFWSMYDDFYAFLSSLSGRTDVKKELGFGKPDNTPGAIVSFNFEGMRVYDRLILNDRVNHVWKLDIPQATRLFTLYQVTVSAKKVNNGTQVTNFLEFVFCSEVLEERQEALALLQKYAKDRPTEIIDFLKERDGDKYHELPQG